MPLPQDTLASWTPTQLTKYIRDLFLNQPPDFLPVLKAEEVRVTRKLTLSDELTISKEPSFKRIGTSPHPAFQNSWVNYSTTPGYQHAGFWKDPLGWVHLRGLIKSGTVNSAAFTLPPGFRPITGEEIYPVLSNDTIGRVNVSSAGVVTPATPCNNTYVSLAGIRFRTT
jgi:hypothetical protein